MYLKFGRGCPLACLSDDSCQQQGCRDRGGGLPLPFVLGLPHLCSLQTFVVAPCDAGGSFFTTTKWKPTSSCDMGGGVIALY